MNSRRQRRRALPTEPIEVTIDSLSHEGRGVGRIDGKVVFVDGALAGEKVEARYVRRRRQLDELTALSIENPSAARVDPGCAFTSQCGGCSLRHMASEQQLQFKESVLLEQLQHTAGVSSEEFALLPRMHGDVANYRRKARLAVRYVAKKGGALVGFREKYSSFITDMDTCQILASEVAVLIAPLRELLSQFSAATQIPQIEVAVGETSAGDSAGVVALVFRHLTPLPEDDERKLLEFAAEHNLHIYLQAGGPDTVQKIYPDEVPRLAYFLPEFGLEMRFHPQDFTQVNASINRQIISRTIELLNLNEDERVLDLFCGLGNFTLPLARHCKQVTGVEDSDAMVRRGEENAKLNGIENAAFFSADLSRPVVDAAWTQQEFDKIVLDPPRSGALEMIPRIAEWQAQRIVYVSCNPATLARDTAELLKRGYVLEAAGVMDMFPHTTHVESMAVFVRK